MANLSKTASNIQAITGTVVSALRVQGPQALAIVLDTVYGGSPPTDLTVRQFIVDLADHFERTGQRAADRATAVLTEMQEDRDASDAEAYEVERMRTQIMSDRSLIDGTYGMGVADGYGYGGITPSTAAELIEASRAIEDKLRKRHFPAQPLPGRRPLDAGDLADGLAARRQALEDAARTNVEEERETQATRSERDTSLDDWRFDYSGMGELAVGLFTLARQHDLADRVRPTARRRQGLPEEEDLEGAGADAPTSPTAADDAAEPAPPADPAEPAPPAEPAEE